MVFLPFWAVTGYRGRDFVCDFEDAGNCGWTYKSVEGDGYMWERRQRGDLLPNSGPSSDYTIGTSAGMHTTLDTVHFLNFRAITVVLL